MTSKAKVASLLVSNPKTWIDTKDITDVGGAGATRRLRELREEGWSIKTRQTGTSHEYQLTRVPAKAKVAQYV